MTYERRKCPSLWEICPRGEMSRGKVFEEESLQRELSYTPRSHLHTHKCPHIQTRTHKHARKYIGDRTDSRADSEKGVVLSEDAFVQKPRRRRNISMKLIKFITSTYNIYHIII